MIILEEIVFGLKNKVYCCQFGSCNNVNIVTHLVVDDNITCCVAKNNKIVGCESGQMYFFGDSI